MKIADIISENAIVLLGESEGIEGKRGLLQALAGKAAALGGLDARTVFDTLLERENLGSTGFGEGTALPHARLAETQKVVALFAKLAKPIDFEAADGKPMDLLFVLLSPEGAGADHLEALAACSKVLKDEAARTNLRAAKTAGEISGLLHSL